MSMYRQSPSQSMPLIRPIMGNIVVAAVVYVGALPAAVGLLDVDLAVGGVALSMVRLLRVFHWGVKPMDSCGGRRSATKNKVRPSGGQAGPLGHGPVCFYV